MGRMHSNGKGLHGSAKPYKRTPPTWFKMKVDEVETTICALARRGLTPSQIGTVLRDTNSIGQVKAVTKTKILRILKKHGLAPEIPEDLYFLIKKAVSIRKHLESNRNDIDARFKLILVEARIYRVSHHAIGTKKLPPTWKYESATASALVA